MDRMVNMVLRQVMRRLLNKGLAKGVAAMGGKKSAPDLQKADQKRAGQSLRLMRRISKF